MYTDVNLYRIYPKTSKLILGRQNVFYDKWGG